MRVFAVSRLQLAVARWCGHREARDLRPPGEGARPGALRTDLQRRCNPVLYPVHAGLPEWRIARTRSLPVPVAASRGLVNRKRQTADRQLQTHLKILA